MMDAVEKSLHALTDYVCSTSIKNVNGRNSHQGLILAMGGKAFNSYIRVPYREDSYDWDCKVYKPDTSQYTLGQACGELLQEMNSIIGRYMTVAPVTVHNTLVRKGLKRSGSNVENIRIQYASRVSVVSGITVHNLVLYCGTKRLFPLIEISTESMMTTTEYDSMLELTRCATFENNYQLTNKMYNVSLDALIDNLHEITTPESTYPKKPKALYRLNVINDAMQNTHKLIPSVNSPIAGLLPEIAFDSTMNPQFIPHQLSQQHLDFIGRHATTARNNRAEYKPVMDYTMDYSVNAELLKKYYLNTPIDMRNTNIVKKLDEAFDYFNQNVVLFAAPLVVYRQTRYIDPPTKLRNISANLYKLKVGDCIPLINYTSSSWTNQVNHSFAEDSQFKGCMFVINIYSSKNVIAVGQQSAFPNEKEILLHRKGDYVITDVSYKFLVEKCNGINVYPERMVITCDYIPWPDVEVNNVNNAHVLVSAQLANAQSVQQPRNMNQPQNVQSMLARGIEDRRRVEMNGPNRDRRIDSIFVPETDFTRPVERYGELRDNILATEWGSRVNRDDKVQKISKTSCAWAAAMIYYLWDSDDDNGSSTVWTALGEVKTSDIILGLLELNQAVVLKTQGFLATIGSLFSGVAVVGSYDAFSGGESWDVKNMGLLIVLVIMIICVLWYNETIGGYIDTVSAYVFGEQAVRSNQSNLSDQMIPSMQ